MKKDKHKKKRFGVIALHTHTECNLQCSFCYRRQTKRKDQYEEEFLEHWYSSFGSKVVQRGVELQKTGKALAERLHFTLTALGYADQPMCFLSARTLGCAIFMV